MAEEQSVPQIKVTVDGSEMDAEAYDSLIEVLAESSVQLPDQVRMRFIDPEFDLYDRDLFKIGAKVVVSMTDGTVPKQIASCQITAVGMEPGADDMMTMTVTALGADHKLHRGIKLATYLDQTDSEIVQKIASDVSLTASVDSSSTRYPHVMQATTHYEFLNQRAERIGYRWWVEDDTLHFKSKPPAEAAATPITWGEDLISLRVVTSSASATNGADVRWWDPDTQKAITGSATSTAGLARLGTDAKGPVAAAKDGRSLASLKRFQGNEAVDDTASAKNLADGLVQRAAEAEVNLRCVVKGDPALRAGQQIQLAECGKRLSGKYRLAKVEHVYRSDEFYVTRFASGGQEPSGLVDLLRSGQPPTTPWSSHGLVIGVVTNIDDPDSPSRVKVKFPTFSDDFESAWARVMMPGAGKDRGLQLHPEVGDEVLVGFEHGNAQRPIVLGGLWSKKNTPPLANADAVSSGVVKSRTWKTRTGHSITINDAEGDPKNSIVLELADGKGTLEIAEEEVKLTTPVDITVTTDKNFKLAAKGDISMEGTNVTIKAKSKAQIEAAQFGAKGSATAKVEAPSIDVKASAKLGMDGGGMAELKAGLVKIN